MRQLYIKAVIFIVIILGSAFAARGILLHDNVPQASKEDLRGILMNTVSDSDVIRSGAFTIENTAYFDNKLWAVASIVPTVKSAAETNIIVFQKVDGMYEIAIGPGTIFASDLITMVPQEVQQHLQSIGVVEGDK